jgi:type I restriction-modification system DNA methylase subunit
MNMILHNITRFTIENGDTLEDPLILDKGQIRKFDRVLANPPFSQNYSRANLKFASVVGQFKADFGRVISNSPNPVTARLQSSRSRRESFPNFEESIAQPTDEL